jgi:alpha-L-fucosidase
MMVLGLCCTGVFAAQPNPASDQFAADDLLEIANVRTYTAELEGKMLIEGERTSHPDAQWFPHAGLGLFIHWGPEAAHGTGEPWLCMVNPNKKLGSVAKHGYSPASEFFEIFKTWNPDRYDPDKWMKAAKEAGFSYVVLTVKHHLGYALWPSDVGEMGVKQYLGGRDLLQLYIDACRKYGLKVGIYYSGIDWYFDREYRNFYLGKDKKLNWKHEEVESLPAMPAGFYSKFIAFDKAQGRELLTRYGKIDLWWPDGGMPFTVEQIRTMQPGIVINNRTQGRLGDYASPEGAFFYYFKARDGAGGVEKSAPIMHEFVRRGYWWENCSIYTKGSWHYGDKDSEIVHEAARFLWDLAWARSFGGNLLANISPRPNGEMPDQYYERCAQLAAWMKHSREALFGINGGALYPEKSNCPATIKDDTWYLFSPPKHWTTKEIFGYGSSSEIKALELKGVPAPKKVRLLRTAETIPYQYSEGRLSITLPPELRTETPDVVAVEFDPETGKPYLFKRGNQSGTAGSID